MVAPTTCPRRLDTIAGKDLGDEYLFYDADGSRVHVLNGIAREVYLLCDGEHSVANLVRSIADRYDVDEETANADLCELLLRLLDLRLISLS